jgi:hypothetical protein
MSHIHTVPSVTYAHWVKCPISMPCQVFHIYIVPSAPYSYCANYALLMMCQVPIYLLCLLSHINTVPNINHSMHQVPICLLCHLSHINTVPSAPNTNCVCCPIFILCQVPLIQTVCCPITILCQVSHINTVPDIQCS